MFVRANAQATNSHLPCFGVHQSSRKSDVGRRRDASYEPELNESEERASMTDEARHSLMRTKDALLDCACRSALCGVFSFLCICCTHTARRPSIRKLIGELGKTAQHLPMTSTLVSLFGLIFVPTLYTSVFLPCFDCHDFEATIAHEAGHLLGFDHPDTFENLNLEYHAKDCIDPLYTGVRLASSESLSDSIMHSQARYRSRTCLTTDDLDGLYALYPSCAGSLVSPVCVRPNKYTGMMRLTLAVLIPFIIATSFLIGTAHLSRHFQTARLKRLQDRNRKQFVQQQLLRAACHNAHHARTCAETELQRTLQRHELDRRTSVNSSTPMPSGTLQRQKSRLANISPLKRLKSYKSAIQSKTDAPNNNAPSMVPRGDHVHTDHRPHRPHTHAKRPRTNK